MIDYIIDQTKAILALTSVNQPDVLCVVSLTEEDSFPAGYGLMGNGWHFFVFVFNLFFQESFISTDKGTI